ncbi:unnamed protein product [Clavelina lepadiformis]|uniref:Uncharacterized protein n=1 Tax=Clavelina lepadiformis TaxID=159417 RepID=A0ABP0EV62_CLALP
MNETQRQMKCPCGKLSEMLTYMLNYNTNRQNGLPTFTAVLELLLRSRHRRTSSDDETANNIGEEPLRINSLTREELLEKSLAAPKISTRISTVLITIPSFYPNFRRCKESWVKEKGYFGDMKRTNVERLLKEPTFGVDVYLVRGSTTVLSHRKKTNWCGNLQDLKPESNPRKA